MTKQTQTNIKKKKNSGVPKIELGISCSQSENNTSRPKVYIEGEMAR